MLSQDLALYVELHRSLGFKFRSQRILLQSFAAFAEEQGDKHVRSDRVIAWAAHAPSAPQRCNRLLTVRRFALAMLPRIPVMRSQQQMRFGARPSAAGRLTSTPPARSRGF